MLRVSSNLFARYYDGVNDYDQNAPATPFVQWERTQPWTFFFRGAWTKAQGNCIVSTRNLGAGVGFLIGQSTSQAFQLDMIGLSGRLQLNIGNLLPGAYTIQIIYNGSSTAAGVSFRVNNVNASTTINQNSLAGSIVQAGQVLRIGQDRNANSYWYGGYIEEVSFVNYVKSVPEMQADFAAGTQSVGSGAYLLKVNPTYNNIITTLDPTLPYLSTDGLGYSINQFGVPNPMTLQNDFRRIASNKLSTEPLYLTRLRRI